MVEVKFEDFMNRMRKQICFFIFFIHTLINCKKSNTFTTHQDRLKNKFQKKYDNTKTRTLEHKLALLKNDLKATCIKLKYSQRTNQRKTINRSFQKTLKEFIEALGELGIC